MLEEVQRLISKYHGKGLLLDSNLLLVLLVGTLDDLRVAKFKRTKEYSALDYDLLNQFIRQFERVITTPNILTEVVNLAKGLQKLPGYADSFRAQIGSLTEEFLESKTVCLQDCFGRLGLTDTAISIVSRKPYLVLTDDLPLYLHLISTGVDAINFNHIRYP